MALAFVRDTLSTANGAITLSTALTAGNGLIVLVNRGPYGTNEAQIANIIDDGGNRYTPAVMSDDGSGPNMCEVWYTDKITNRATAVTITHVCGAFGTRSVRIIEVSGCSAGGLALDFTSGAPLTAYLQGNSTAPSSGSTPTTTQAAEFIVGLIGSDVSTNTYSAITAGFTNATQTSSTTISTVSGYQVVSSTAAFTYAATQSASNTWMAMVACFYAAASPPTDQCVQATLSTGGKDSASMTGQMPYNVQGGNRIIVATAIANGTITVSKVTDDKGNQYVKDTSVAGASTTLEVWSAVLMNGAGTKPTITVALSSSSTNIFWAAEYSGLAAQAGAVSTDPSLTGSGDNVSTVTLGPTTASIDAPDMALGVFTNQDNGKDNYGSNAGWYRRWVSTWSGYNMDFGIFDKIVTPAGTTTTLTINGITNVSQPYAAALVVYRPLRSPGQFTSVGKPGPRLPSNSFRQGGQ